MLNDIYLVCLDHEEISYPVGNTEHSNYVADIRKQWNSKSISQQVLDELGLEFADNHFVREGSYRHAQNMFQERHRKCWRHVLIRVDGAQKPDVLVRVRDWRCHYDGCNKPVTHGYFSKRFPGLGDILACRDHGLGEPIYSPDGLVHLAVGKYSIFHEHVKKRRVDKGV